MSTSTTGKIASAFGDDLAALHDLDQEKLDEDLLDYLSQARHALEDLAEEATRRAGEMAQVQERFGAELAATY